MAVIETRAKVSILDGATSTLQKISNANDRLTASLGRAGKEASGFSVNMTKLSTGSASNGGKQLASNFDEASNSITNANKMLSRLTYSVARYTVIYQGISKLGDLWDDVVGGAYRYANMLETNRVGMAGILSSMMELDGKQMDWNTSMNVSAKIMKDLQDESLKTAATADELVETFRALLGPGLGAGMSIKQIERLSVVGTNAVKSMGLPSNQIVQELRDLVQGGIRPASSTLATALGISDSDIKAVKQSGASLFDFLMNRMKGFEKSSEETSKTVQGRIAQIEEALQRGIAEGAAPLRALYSETLEKITKELLKENDLTGKLEINPDFKNDINSISDKIINIVQQGKDAVNLFSPLLKILGGVGLSVFDQLTNHLEGILLLWGGFKISKYVKDIANMVVHTREEYQATTMVGKMLQGINDKIHHRAEKEKEALEIQQAQAEWQAKENELIDAATSAYGKMVGKITESANEQRTLNSMVDSATNSVTHLAEKWQAMGMSASQSIHGQNLVTGLVNNGQYEKAEVVAEAYDKQAEAIQKQAETLKAQEEQQKHQIELYNQQAQAIEKVVQAEHERQRQVETVAKEGLQNISRAADVTYGQDKAKQRVTAFLQAGSNGNGGYVGKAQVNRKTVYKWQFEAVDELYRKLQSLGYEENIIFATTEKFMDSLKTGMKGTVQPIIDQAISSAKLWQETLNSARSGSNITNSQLTYDRFMAQTGSTLRTQNNYAGGKDLETRTESLKMNQQIASQLLADLQDKFQKVGMSADEAKAKAYDFTAQFVQGLKSINATNPVSVSNVFKQVSDSAQTYAEKFKLVQEQTEAVAKANAEAALEFNALSNAFKVGGETAYEAVRRVLETTDALVKALNERGATEQANAVLKERANYLQQVAKAEDQAALAVEKEMKATQEATEALKLHTKAAEEDKNMAVLAAEKYGKYAGRVSIASGNLAIMTDIAAQAADSNDGLASKAADAAFQISMVAMAADGLIGLLPGLVNWLQKTAEAFRQTAFYKGLASLPGPAIAAMGITAGAIGFGVGVYGKIKNAESGDTNLHTYFSDAELGGYDTNPDDDGEGQIKRSALANGPDRETVKSADAYDEALYGVHASSSMQDQLEQQARVSEAQAQKAQEAIANAQLNPDVTSSGEAGSGGKSGGSGGSSRPQVPTIPMTPALEAALGLMNGGMDIDTASAFVGNFMTESGGNTQNIDPAISNELGAHGIGQWLDRYDDLVAYTKAVHGENWQDHLDDIANQVGFTQYELNGKESYAAQKIAEASGVAEKARAVDTYYERPGNDGTMEKRVANAEEIHDILQQLQEGTLKIEGYSRGKSGIDAEVRRQQELIRKYNEAMEATTKGITDLKNETADILGTQDAYDKTIAESDNKLKEYQKQIENDKALGVSTDELSKAMKDYAAAMQRKAIEAQQNEDISRFNNQLSLAQNMPLGFGEADTRTAQLTDMLEQHKAQLETWLQDTELTYQQRVTLENELAQTIKSINDQSVTDYKEGWKQALTEISNEQVNWKGTWTSMLTGVESSMEDALTTSGNFTTRMSSLFKGMAQSVVKALASVISRLLMVKMITGIFGGGSLSGGSSIIPNGVTAKSYLGWDMDSMMGHFASGGNAAAGQLAMVGEQGPELVRFGQNAHVYNNSETSRMLSGGNTNVQVVVNNNTGTEMEARQETTRDTTGRELHTIILTTVGDALSTNEYGLRDAIMGVK